MIGTLMKMMISMIPVMMMIMIIGIWYCNNQINMGTSSL